MVVVLMRVLLFRGFVGFSLTEEMGGFVVSEEGAFFDLVEWQFDALDGEDFFGHEKDRYNFNGGAVDIATGLPDNANGRFAVLGWAKSFITNGKVEKKVTWKKGRISSTTTIENPPRR